MARIIRTGPEDQGGLNTPVIRRISYPIHLANICQSKNIDRIRHWPKRSWFDPGDGILFPPTRYTTPSMPETCWLEAAKGENPQEEEVPVCPIEPKASIQTAHRKERGFIQNPLIDILS